MPHTVAKKRKKYQVDPDERRLLQERYADIVSRFNDGEFGPYRHVSMEEYFRILFEREGEIRLQENGKEHFKDGHYNAIIRKISKGGKESHIWWIVTDTLAGIEQYRKVKFAITSPVTYAGKERSLYKRETDDTGKLVKVDHSRIGNARYLFGLAIDVDKVYLKNLRYLHHQINQGHYPEPTMLVTSGTGLHIYYCFDKPIRITKDNLYLLNLFKYSVTCMMWSYNGTSQQRKVEVHNIGQGYRIPDTQTKFDRVVLGWIRTEKPCYYTIRELNEYVKTWRRVRPEQFDETKVLADATITYLENGCKKTGLDKKQLRELEKDLRMPAHWSLATAREKFGEDWYEYVKEHGSKDWNYDPKLYTYWLKRLQYGADSGTAVSIGHRYWCIYILAAWAFNCNIPFAQLQRDAYSLMENFNNLVDDEDKHVPFTIRDCNAALNVYKERKASGNSKAIRLSRVSTQRITGLRIEPNKRNYNDLSTHGKYRLNKRIEYAREDGKDWTDTIVGRPTKEQLIADWRAAHPEGTQYGCAKELGISRTTVVKWWNCTAEDAKAEYDRINAVYEAGLAAIREKESVNGYDQPDTQPSELHDLGAEVNTGYMTDRNISDMVMQNSEGYSDQSAETIKNIGDELADAINFGALNVENLMRSMGFPEYLIPIMKADLERQMQTQEFWDEFKKSRSETDMNNWPPEMKRAYEACIEDHKNKK